MAGQTVDGRVVTEERSMGGHLQERVEYVRGPVWHCTCGVERCQHLRQIMRQETLGDRLRQAFSRRIQLRNQPLRLKAAGPGDL